MNELKDISELINPSITQLDIFPTLFSFLMCILMAFIVRDFYIKRSFSLTGKMHIGSIIPVLSAVVFLVIIVVKSSLALSLGLVGALSIVRFRTPIKEPEELVYLFLAIAIGLGYAAGQILMTTILVLSILFIIYMWLSNRKVAKNSEYNLVVKWTELNILFEDILKEITPIVQNLKLVRLDKGPLNNTAVMLIIPDEDLPVEGISDRLHKLDKGMKITFFESKTNW
jgi:asparagine N-glycosylation enzyme membrane subunit Stt3